MVRLAMVEANPSDQNCNDQLDRRQIEKPAPNSLEGTTEGQQVRNAKGDLVEAIKAANPNASDGSVKNWEQMTGHERYAYAQQDGQEESFVLVDQKPLGIEVVAARQMAPGVKLESQEQAIEQNVIVQNLSEVDKRPIYDYGWGFKPDIPSMAETGLEYQAGYRVGSKKLEVTEQEVFERVAVLPLDKQAQVLSAGIQAYQHELNYQQFRMVIGHITGVGESVVGMSQGADSLGKSICDVAQFSQDIAENNPRAQDTATQAGHSFGKLLVGGIKVVKVADNYLGSVGAASYEGDNTKAFRDISALGQKMNQRWAEMSTEEKSKFTTKLTLDNLGPIAAAGVGAKLAKSIDVTGALQDLGSVVSVFGPKEREKYSLVIGKIAEKLTIEPMGVTPDGCLMSIPRDHFENDANVLMSKADDLGNSGRLVSKGVDVTGKALAFSKDSGIELGAARLGQDGLWQEVPVVRGNEVHVGLGENLPSGTKTIDRVVIRDGVAESIKSIDPRLDSFRQPSDFRSKINDYLHKMEIYEGQPKRRGGFRMKHSQIEQKVLHLGVPDGSLNPEQIKVLEEVGRNAMKYNKSLSVDQAPIKIKVTVLK